MSWQVCQSTGKLRLVDSTGAIDAVVPDLQSVSSFHCVYMVVMFQSVLEYNALLEIELCSMDNLIHLYGMTISVHTRCGSASRSNM